MLAELGAHLTTLGELVEQAASEPVVGGASPSRGSSRKALEDVLRTARLRSKERDVSASAARNGGGPRDAAGQHDLLTEDFAVPFPQQPDHGHILVVRPPPLLEAPTINCGNCTSRNFGWVEEKKWGVPLTPRSVLATPRDAFEKTISEHSACSANLTKIPDQHVKIEKTDTTVTGRSSRFTWRAKHMAEAVDNLLFAVSNEYVEDSNDPQDCRGWIGWVLERSWFESMIAALIMANALVMGLQADWKMRHGEESPLMRAMDSVFTVGFLVEIILRLVGEGRRFMSRSNPKIMWNVFDVAITAANILDEFVNLLGFDTGVMDISVLRLFRVLRLARVLRIVRVMRFFRDLRVMITGILHSLKSLTWALALLVLWMYLFSVLIMDTINMYADERDLSSVDVSPYNNLMRSMYTLFGSVFGGIDWAEVSDPLWDINPVLLLAFMLYISFAHLCVLNIVTGVFVENANKITLKAEGEALLEELEARKAWLAEVQLLFARAVEDDEDGCRHGIINAARFEKLVANYRVQAIFRKLGIEIERNHARGLFNLLDFDGDGEVDAEEFAAGLDQLHGQAKSVDLVRLGHNLRKLDAKVTRMMMGERYDSQRSTSACSSPGGAPRSRPRFWTDPSCGTDQHLQ